VRILFTALLLLATGARAEEAGTVVRPLLGISGSLSDSGAGVGAQLGIRLSSVLLRLTLDLGGGMTGRGYVAGTLPGA
jgi:hypothetical protein